MLYQNTLIRALCRVFASGDKDPHFALRFPYNSPEIATENHTLENSCTKSFMSSLMSLTSFVHVEPPMSPAAEAFITLRNGHLLHGKIGHCFLWSELKTCFYQMPKKYRKDKVHLFPIPLLSFFLRVPVGVNLY